MKNNLSKEQTKKQQNQEIIQEHVNKYQSSPRGNFDAVYVLDLNLRQQIYDAIDNLEVSPTSKLSIVKHQINNKSFRQRIVEVIQI